MFGNEVEKLNSFLGSESEFQGELTAKGILRMDGTVKGKVQADEVILSETALVRGDIVARKIVVGGKVIGNLRARDLVEIKPKGNVIGDIFTNKLLVIEGAEFNGQIEMGAGELNVPDFDFKEEKVFV